MTFGAPITMLTETCRSIARNAPSPPRTQHICVQRIIAAVGTRVTAGATANLSPCHLSANVIFRSIGVERNLGTLEHHEQFGLLFVQPNEQTVECDESGLELEDAIEPCQQYGLASLSRTATVSLQGT